MCLRVYPLFPMTCNIKCTCNVLTYIVCIFLLFTIFTIVFVCAYWMSKRFPFSYPVNESQCIAIIALSTRDISGVSVLQWRAPIVWYPLKILTLTSQKTVLLAIEDGLNISTWNSNLWIWAAVALIHRLQSMHLIVFHCRKITRRYDWHHSPCVHHSIYTNCILWHFIPFQWHALALWCCFAARFISNISNIVCWWVAILLSE